MTQIPSKRCLERSRSFLKPKTQEAPAYRDNERDSRAAESGGSIINIIEAGSDQESSAETQRKYYYIYIARKLETMAL